jgi:hypothetical protein
MKTLLAPAVLLMQRLRLLPKFALVALVFIAPLLLTASLLFFELNKSLAVAEQERAGVRYVQHLEDVMRLVQTHRAFRLDDAPAITAPAASAIVTRLPARAARTRSIGYRAEESSQAYEFEKRA